MSRAPLILSAAAIFCASSYLALADEQRAIATRLESAAIANSANSRARHHYHPARHYRGYDESPSATIVSSHAA